MRIRQIGNHVPNILGVKKKRIFETTTCRYLEPVCPLFCGLNPPKEGPFHSKQGSVGFQVYTLYFLCGGSNSFMKKSAHKEKHTKKL